MHHIDAYKAAAEIANTATRDKYQTDRWSVGSAAHQFWLSIFDVTFKTFLLKEGR